MRQLAGFLGGCFVDGSPPVPHRHGQSSKVLLVSLRGRRAVAAIQILYADASDALARKRARADRAMAWRPRVMARYPWSRWGNGERWTLQRGTDYEDRRRLWEAGRRAARGSGRRLELLDVDENRVRLRFLHRD